MCAVNTKPYECNLKVNESKLGSNLMLAVQTNVWMIPV